MGEYFGDAASSAFEQFRRQEAAQARRQEAARIFHDSFTTNTQRSQEHPPLTINDLLGALGKVKQRIPDAPKPKSPKERIAEIDAELDICRGRVPTPPGYKIDPSRVRALMAERKSLEEKITKEQI
jgi:hypothetical protein